MMALTVLCCISMQPAQHAKKYKDSVQRSTRLIDICLIWVMG